jgi:uncharacterized protein (TIGR03118 family)
MPARTSLLRRLILVVTFVTAMAVTSIAGPIPGNKFKQTNLVSDIPGVAANTDPDLVNPWGIALSSGSPFWISDNGTGLSTLYTGSGTKLGLIVTIPPAPGSPPPGDPTGVVFNGTANFGGNHFIFATESGTVAGWASGTTATNIAIGSPGSIYKGIAIGSSDLFLANFGLGRIDAFDTSLAAATLTGSFTDPTLPSGYAPFNVENLGGTIYVTYAKTSGGVDEVDGAGLGFVDAYDANGNFLRRVFSQGVLNAPWGMAIAPDGFGKFGGDLLVGNFGDGTINAFDLASGTWRGTLSDMNGNPIVNEGLWGLTFGNGGNGGSLDELYLTAGIPGPGEVEDHGLFASITATPEPSSLVMVGVGLLGALRLRKRLKN